MPEAVSEFSACWLPASLQCHRLAHDVFSMMHLFLLGVYAAIGALMQPAVPSQRPGYRSRHDASRPPRHVCPVTPTGTPTHVPGLPGGHVQHVVVQGGAVVGPLLAGAVAGSLILAGQGRKMGMCAGGDTSR